MSGSFPGGQVDAQKGGKRVDYSSDQLNVRMLMPRGRRGEYPRG